MYILWWYNYNRFNHALKSIKMLSECMGHDTFNKKPVGQAPKISDGKKIEVSKLLLPYDWCMHGRDELSLKKQFCRFTIHNPLSFQHWHNWSFYWSLTFIVSQDIPLPVHMLSSDWRNFRNFRRGWSLSLSRWHHKLMNIIFCEDYGKYTFSGKKTRRHLWGICLYSCRMILAPTLQ